MCVCVCVCVCVCEREREREREREPDPGNSFCDGSVPRDTNIVNTGLYLREKPYEIGGYLKSQFPPHRNTVTLI